MRVPFTPTTKVTVNQARDPRQAAVIIFQQLAAVRFNPKDAPKAFYDDVLATAIAACPKEITKCLTDWFKIELSTTSLGAISEDFPILHRGCIIVLPTHFDNYFDVGFISENTFSTKRYNVGESRDCKVAVKHEYLSMRTDRVCAIVGDGYFDMPLDMIHDINHHMDIEAIERQGEFVNLDENKMSKRAHAAETLVGGFINANDAGLLNASFVRAFNDFAQSNDEVSEVLRRENIVIDILPNEVAVRRVVSRLYPINH